MSQYLDPLLFIKEKGGQKGSSPSLPHFSPHSLCLRMMQTVATSQPSTSLTHLNTGVQQALGGSSGQWVYSGKRVFRGGERKCTRARKFPPFCPSVTRKVAWI